jgi:hypothetical protein
LGSIDRCAGSPDFVVVLPGLNGSFDERNLFEITHVDYPGERLIACRNPVLGCKRARKRWERVNATLVDVGMTKARVDTNHESLEGEAAMGGITFMRTSLAPEGMSSAGLLLPPA